MSKITFRADADLVERVERLDASKSEVMREALRQYLDDPTSAEETGESSAAGGTLDEFVEQRVDELVEARLDELRAQDVNVNVNLENARASSPAPAPASGHRARDAAADPVTTCAQCGETVDEDHAYCPNCGESVTEAASCDCGVELSPDWVFCPHCGRRTPSADVLDS